VTLPVSHVQGPSGPAPTRTWYAVCMTPRAGEVNCQASRGWRTSMPMGLVWYSQRNCATATSGVPLVIRDCPFDYEV